MQPVMCHTCAAQVMVKKLSLAHTSIQWAEAETCVEFAPDLENRATTRGCSQLRTSIEQAVVDGKVEVRAGTQ